MPVIRGHNIATRVVAVGLLALLGCGDDDSTPGHGTGHRDASAPQDAATDASMDAEVSEPPITPVMPKDAGRHDATTPPDTVPDAAADATTPIVPLTCADLDCNAMSDDCNVVTCNPKTVTCVSKRVADDTPCGSQALDNCSAPDRCTAGVCEPRDTAAGTPCGDTNATCRVNDTCDGAGTCVDHGFAAEGTACGEQTPSDADCDAPDTCDADGVCQPRYAALDTPCGDEDVSCRYDDKCDGFGSCQDGGKWEAGACPNGEDSGKCVCGRVDVAACHPTKDLCDDGVCVLGNEPDGTACGNPTPTDAQCDNADSCLLGICSPNPKIAGTVCGDQVTDTMCDRKDQCDGGGHCDDNFAGPNVVCGAAPGLCADEQMCNGNGGCATAQFKGAGSVCGAAPDACHLERKCTGGSNTCPAALAAPMGTACGNANATDPTCDAPDSCDASGNCDTHHQSAGIDCGNHSTTECSDPDTCNADGTCNPHHHAMGSMCGDQGMTCLNDDSCNNSGVCVDGGYDSPCPLSGILTADNAPVVGQTVKIIGGATSSTTAADGSFTLNAPLGQEILLQTSPLAGFYGEVRAVTFGAADIARTLELSLQLDDDTAEGAQALSLAVDTNKGLVIVTVGGTGLNGDEGASLSIASAQAISYAGGNFQFSSTIVLPQPGSIMFYNATPTGSASISPIDGLASTCRRSSSFATFPVVAHTISWVDVVCE